MYGITEVKRDGRQFRAHPNFHSGKPWYDWAMVEFERDGPNDKVLIPSRLLGFVVVPLRQGDDYEKDETLLLTKWDTKVKKKRGRPKKDDVVVNNDTDNIETHVKVDENVRGIVYAIVHCTAFQTDDNHNNQSVLTREWDLEYDNNNDIILHSVLLSNIKKEVLMVPDTEGVWAKKPREHRCREIIDYSLWSSEFNE